MKFRGSTKKEEDRREREVRRERDGEARLNPAELPRKTKREENGTEEEKGTEKRDKIPRKWTEKRD